MQIRVAGTETEGGGPDQLHDASSGAMPAHLLGPAGLLAHLQTGDGDTAVERKHPDREAAPTLQAALRALKLPGMDDLWAGCPRPAPGAEALAMGGLRAQRHVVPAPVRRVR